MNAKKGADKGNGRAGKIEMEKWKRPGVYVVK